MNTNSAAPRRSRVEWAATLAETLTALRESLGSQRPARTTGHPSENGSQSSNGSGPRLDRGSGSLKRPAPEENGWEPLRRAGAEAAARLIYPALTSRAAGHDLLAPLRDWAESALPKGRVTFLLGDIEGSTRLWEQSPDATALSLERRDELVSEIVLEWGGLLPREQGEGDSFFAVFENASDAVGAAVELQRAFSAETWPEGAALRIRMALHTGEAQLRNGNYYGVEVNRCARIRSLAHGGQVLLSGPTAQEALMNLPEGASLRSMGEQPLRDLSRPERIHQLIHPDLPTEFPPLRAASLV